MSNNQARPDDYEVGYGRPPKDHRFKKGAPSANPLGRPRKLLAPGSSETLDELLLQEISRHIPLTERGKEITLPVVHGILRSQVYLALKGNQRAVQDILQRAERAITARKKAETLRTRVDVRGMDAHAAARAYQAMVRGELS